VEKIIVKSHFAKFTNAATQQSKEMYTQSYTAIERWARRKDNIT